MAISDDLKRLVYKIIALRLLEGKADETIAEETGWSLELIEKVRKAIRNGFRPHDDNSPILD